MRAAECEGEVVPLAVGVLAGRPLVSTGVQHEFAVLYSQQGTLDDAVGVCPRGAEQRCVGGFGLEPEHQCLVVVLGAPEQIGGELYMLVFELERYALLQFPGRVAQVQRCAVGLVAHHIALTFVHAVVREQFAFVTGEVVGIGSGYIVRLQRLGPYACLEHIARIAVTEHERRGYVELRLVGQRTGSRVGHLVGGGKEPNGLRRVVEGHDHTRELEHR